MDNRERLIENWKKTLAGNASKIIALQKAIREPNVKSKIDLVARELQNTFKLAHMTIGKIEKLTGVSRTSWRELSITLGRNIGLFTRLCKTSQHLLREFNWSFRRRITEVGDGGISIEEVGTKRISFNELGILRELVSAIVAGNWAAYDGINSVFCNMR